LTIASLEKWKEAVSQYLKTLTDDIGRGIYTEHTHRPTLKTFLESVCPSIVATNEPQRVECGGPDFITTHGVSPWGSIETKDIDVSLDKEEKSEQLTRYRTLPNLILTDYLEFRWYRDGTFREPIVRIAELKNKKLIVSESGITQLYDLLLGFLNANVRTVKDSKHLAQMLAGLTRTLETSIHSAYALEGDEDELHNYLRSIREVLVHEFTPEQFADMYAQTISYGLFAARSYCKNPNDFTRQNAAFFIPKTNPFLSNLFSLIAGPNLNARYSWVVDDIAELLAKTDIEVIWKDFGTAKDPVVDFYERFLAIYDPKLRELRGVYFTPTEVVDYIVNSVHAILQNDFGVKDALADSKSLVLDPACGTGTFLYSLIRLLRSHLKGQEGSWAGYVSQNLLKRMFGFELLMAPYVVAHLKLALELQAINSGYKQDQRFGIYLTNSLEEGLKKSEVMLAKWLSDEANAASEIKREKPIMVVFGNPPYSGHSPNKGEWIKSLVHDYRVLGGKVINEKQVKWLQDDYVKFIRFGQWRIEQTGQGILGYITNHAYLDDITFYAMRKNLLDHFTKIYVLNLHGNRKRNPRGLSPDGTIDQNVFDITQGVAISIFVKNPKEKPPATIHYYDLWGIRKDKYAFLEKNTTLSTQYTEWHLSTTVRIHTIGH
jgi:predicted helicase